MITLDERQAIKLLEAVEQLAYSFKEYAPKAKYSERNFRIGMVSESILDLIKHIENPTLKKN